MRKFQSDWNDFIEQAGPILDQVSAAIEQVTKDLNSGQYRRENLVNTVEKQVVNHDRIFIASIPARNDELRRLRDEIDSARKSQRDAVQALSSLIPPETPIYQEAERRTATLRYFERTQQAYADSIRKIVELITAYSKAHGFE